MIKLEAKTHFLNQYAKISNPYLINKIKQFKDKTPNFLISKYLELRNHEKFLYDKMHFDLYHNQI